MVGRWTLLTRVKDTSEWFGVEVWYVNAGEKKKQKRRFTIREGELVKQRVIAEGEWEPPEDTRSQKEQSRQSVATGEVGKAVAKLFTGLKSNRERIEQSTPMEPSISQPVLMPPSDEEIPPSRPISLIASQD